MTTNLSHFAINADNVPASRAFYESVFGWQFTAWGPPDFLQIQTGTKDEPGVQGAMQQRRNLLGEVATFGLECTFTVADVDATAEAVRQAGGTILMPRVTINGVGHLIFFQDPGGNAIGAMQYDDSSATRPLARPRVADTGPSGWNRRRRGGRECAGWYRDVATISTARLTAVRTSHASENAKVYRDPAEQRVAYVEGAVDAGRVIPAAIEKTGVGVLPRGPRKWIRTVAHAVGDNFGGVKGKLPRRAVAFSHPW